jgi:hypothetical protein
LFIGGGAYKRDLEPVLKTLLEKLELELIKSAAVFTRAEKIDKAEAANITAASIGKPIAGCVGILFIEGGAYKWDLEPVLKTLLEKLELELIKSAAVFTRAGKKVTAASIGKPIAGCVGILFIGGGAYKWDLELVLKTLLEKLEPELIKSAVVFTKAGKMDKTEQYVQVQVQ